MDRAKRSKIADVALQALRNLSFFSADEYESLTSRERARLEYVCDGLAGLSDMINEGSTVSTENEADTAGG